jgi:hypothetical protein
LRAAGFSPPVRRKWSREIVLRELRARYRPGVSRTCFWAENSQLAGAAKRYVGGKRRALICAGLSREDPRPLRKWSREDVIDAIQAWYRQGRSLKHLGREDPGLYASAKRWFGRWSDAVRAAGLDPNIPRHWSPDDVLDAIRSRHQAGLPMTGVYHASPSLFAAAKRRFGSWHRAMVAAGLDSIQRKQWTNSIVLAAIRNHHARGTLSRVWREAPSLLNAGCKRFGSWQNALAAAGLEPRRLQRWSTERILRELRPWNGQTQHAVRLADPRLADAAARYFGSLQKAAEAAGIELRQRKWTPKRIIEAIQDRYVRGLPLLPCLDRRLFGAATRVFGTWRDAVAAAGLAHKLPQPKDRRLEPRRQNDILRVPSISVADVA